MKPVDQASKEAIEGAAFVTGVGRRSIWGGRDGRFMDNDCGWSFIVDLPGALANDSDYDHKSKDLRSKPNGLRSKENQCSA